MWKIFSISFCILWAVMHLEAAPLNNETSLVNDANNLNNSSEAAPLNKEISLDKNVNNLNNSGQDAPLNNETSLVTDANNLNNSGEAAPLNNKISLVNDANNLNNSSEAAPQNNVFSLANDIIYDSPDDYSSETNGDGDKYDPEAFLEAFVEGFSGLFSPFVEDNDVIDLDHSDEAAPQDNVLSLANDIIYDSPDDFSSETNEDDDKYDPEAFVETLGEVFSGLISSFVEEEPVAAK